MSLVRQGREDMIDIVELLRRGVNTNEPPDRTDRVMGDAADEIERLRAALSVAGLWRDLGEENVRLRALNAELLARYDALEAYVLAAQIEAAIAKGEKT
jgi:hypothetical protein